MKKVEKRSKFFLLVLIVIMSILEAFKMNLKTGIYTAAILAILGVFAWLNPSALDYKFALLVVGSLMIVGGFINRGVISDFIKAKYGDVKSMITSQTTNNDSGPEGK